MRNLSIIIALSFSGIYFSQVAIGKTSVSNTSVSLEFGNDNKGIILPWAANTGSISGAVNGTLVYDTSDHKVKYLKSGSWFDLNGETEFNPATVGAADTSLQDSKTETSTAKVVIGANGATDSTPGILVLTDTDKAMILPKVASPHLNIINPAPGMMVYDTTLHMLAVFNGTVWSFWKP
ncbi:hypothetical protein [Chryseobacterium sp. KCF3-3]|uniref:hypothetical protein n=1 Tax=Chryseobacterium sp. KCF3-3 TaxID=3231511 RepID=UPI0038B3BF01